MNISDLVFELKKLWAEHGDIPCSVWCLDSYADGETMKAVDAHLCLEQDGDKVSRVTFSDHETAHAFSG